MNTYRVFPKGPKLRTLAAIALSGLLVSSCSSTSDSSGTGLKLVGNFYPVTWLVERIAGDGAQVTSLTPKGVEPHDLQLDARSLALIQDADMVFYLGSEFQPEVEQAVIQLEDGSKAIDLLNSPGVRLLDAKEDDHSHDHDHDHDHEKGHAHGSEDKGEHKHSLAGGKDPHIWLDPANMVSMARSISSELTRLSPESEAVFTSNLERLIDELEFLDQEISKQLSDCKIKTIVTSHAAFLYFTEKYGFEQLAIAGISPDDEPDAKRIAGIADAANDAGVATVYFEEVLSPALAETVAREVGAELSVLSTLELEPESGDYISKMKSNLQNLVLGQGCSK